MRAGDGAVPPPDGTAVAARRRRPLRASLGLRARVTFMFAVGALVLSAVMAGITYFTARASFINERQTAVQRQAFVNASLVQNALRVPGTDVNQLLESVDTLPGSRSVLFVGGKWYATSLSVGQSAIPLVERTTVLTGTPASQTFLLNGSPELVVGVPLPGVRAFYFEAFSLDELNGTLRTLALTLGLAALVTIAAGAAVGRWAAGRALRPLAGFSEAAGAIAAGDLSTRVEAADDKDLADLANSFNRMATNLEDRIEREARFTSDVSHELRSPLTTLSASAGVLATHRADMPPRVGHAVDLLEADLVRFTRMVDDLLEISRLDAGSAELSLDDVDPSELVRQAVVAAGRGSETVPVEVGPQVEGLRLRVDKRRFERVMANLIDNARIYAGGATAVTVTTGPATADGVATIRVAIDDHGQGVPVPERERVFERFSRGQAAGRRGSGDGTGLGLSLVAEHVRLHGGRVWVEDAPGGGARFVVELPIEPSPVASREPVPPQGRGRPGGEVRR